jgi:probable addiction module antidote protein
MNTIFIGGSRHISRLPPEVRKRLDNVVASGHRVIVGDANGADKALQKYFLEKGYDKVTVFCSGETPRNNLGTWHTRRVDAPKNAKGFHFYAAKDREMAREADFGLMIWDGKSPGTVLNALRLALAGKIAVLFDVPDKEVINIKTVDAWKRFISHRKHELQVDVKERATKDEWSLVESDDQTTFMPTFEENRFARIESDTPNESPETPLLKPLPLHEVARVLNEGLAHGDATAIMDALGRIARERGMSHVARETGLSRESLYRSLDARGNPEFATVLKVLASIGLRLEAKPER